VDVLQTEAMSEKRLQLVLQILTQVLLALETAQQLLQFTHYHLRFQDLVLRRFQRATRRNAIGTILYPISQTNLQTILDAIPGIATKAAEFIDHPTLAGYKVMSVRADYLAVIHNLDEAVSDQHDVYRGIQYPFSTAFDVVSLISSAHFELHRVHGDNNLEAIYESLVDICGDNLKVDVESRVATLHEEDEYDEQYMVMHRYYDDCPDLTPAAALAMLAAQFPQEMREILFKVEETDMIVPNKSKAGDFNKICS
jgi:hypothetical protein